MPDSDAYICLQNAAVAVGVDLDSIPPNMKPDLVRQAEFYLAHKREQGSEHTVHEMECLKSMLRRCCEWLSRAGPFGPGFSFVDTIYSQL